MHIFFLGWFLFLVGSLQIGPATAAPVPSGISAVALQEDMDFLLKTVCESHPDIGFSTSEARLTTALDAIKRDLPPSMTRDEAWRHLAKINPVFADGHLMVALPDWRGQTTAWLAAGGTLFPYEVTLDAQGRLTIDAALGGAPSDLSGARIVAIDDTPTSTLVPDLMARVHGDTPAFRANLLAQRWWLYHWKTIGAARHYALTLERAGKRWTVKAPASTSLPRVLRDEADFARLFRLETVPSGTAVLTVAAFDPRHHEQFLAFTEAAFERIHNEGIRKLVIDISANGGGDDALWLDGLMPYLATRRYRTGSNAVKRVLKANPERGEQAGQIVHGQIETWREPQPPPPLHFTGEVEVAIGPATYSSAVLFANVMRDFGFATLVGTGGAARRSQSGGVRGVTLPQSGLVLWLPRFVIAPPLGAPRDALLETGASGPGK